MLIKYIIPLLFLTACASHPSNRLYCVNVDTYLDDVGDKRVCCSTIMRQSSHCPDLYNCDQGVISLQCATNVYEILLNNK